MRKLGLLLWKSYCFRKRDYLYTFLLLIVPTPWVLQFPFIMKVAFNDTISQPAVIFDPHRQNELKHEFATELGNDPLLYAPSTGVTDFASIAMENLKSKINAAIMGFENEEALFTYYSTLNITNSTNVYAVIFESLPSDGSVPKHFKYKIRIASNISQQTTKLLPGIEETKMFSKEVGPRDIYRSTKFAGLQLLLDEIYMEMSNVQFPDIQVQKFPYPAHIPEELRQFAIDVFSFSFLLVSGGIFITSLRELLEEKQAGTKELMKVNGINTWMLWLVWCIVCMVFATLCITIGTINFKMAFFGEYALLSHSNPLLVWLFLMLYFSAGAAFLLALSCLFSNPILAMTIVPFLWIMPCVITYFAQRRKMSAEVKYVLSFVPSTVIIFGSEILFSYEYQGNGLQWNNLFEGNVAMGPILIILVIDCVIYVLIACYLEAIMPGKYGMPKPVHFIFMPSFWKARKVNITESEDADVTGITAFEAPSETLKAGIRIRNLHKVYNSSRRNPIVAVNGLSLDMYFGEITALLGHNGSGKTTVISVLTGMISASSGAVYVNDYDITTNINKVRENLGYCPQENLFCAHLSVLEHLTFFAALKGCSNTKARESAENVLKQLNLAGKENEMVSGLSDGMKRKLSLGIALAGNSSIIILDEPTSGMDVEGRRTVWDLLLSMRSQRIILISTHLMEEADILGDRIAIMVAGKIQCYGTSLFLKKRYGHGYQLTLLKQDNCDANEVTKSLKAEIPNVVLKNETTYILNYSLPYDNADKFAEFFDFLERQKRTLGVSSIGMSIMTLDEVFMRAYFNWAAICYLSRIGACVLTFAGDKPARAFAYPGVEEEHKEQQGDTRDGDKTVENVESYHGSLEAVTTDRLKGWSLFCQRMKALLIKQIILSRGILPLLIAQAMMVFGCTIWLVVQMNATGRELQKNTSPLELKLEEYGKTVAIYSGNNNNKQLMEQYVETLKMTGSEPQEADSVINSLFSIGEKDRNTYDKEYIVAADFGNNITAMYSTVAYHSLPISLNLIMNSILRPQGSSIVVTNHPLNVPKEMPGKNILEDMHNIFIAAELMNVITIFIIVPNAERVNKAKRMQNISGASPPIYWLSYFLWDFLLYLTIVAFMLIIVLIVDEMKYFSGAKEIGVLMLMLTLYGWSAIPTAYLFSYFGKTDIQAMYNYEMANGHFAVTWPTIVYLTGLSDTKGTFISRVLVYMPNLSPHFPVAIALRRFSNLAIWNNQCKSVSCKKNAVEFCCHVFKKDPSRYVKPYLAFPSNDNPNGLLTEVLFLAFDGFLYFSLLALLDDKLPSYAYEFLLRFRCSSFSGEMLRMLEDVLEVQPMQEGDDDATEEQTMQQLDADVAEEQNYVLGKLQGRESTSNERDDIMLVGDLVKKYGRRIPAVKGVSFGAMKGECFGLLGCNGAGKTTIFKMLTNDEIPTKGDAKIANYTLRKHTKQFIRQIGYCPQGNAFNEPMTGRQILQLYAALCGIPKKHASQEVNKWISLTGLQQYEKQRSGTYSGGTKRKLSTAVAFILNPTIIFLDEPTRGIDPVSRRSLWNIFDKKQNSGQSIVLTSHSMDECEALCGRLAIMVNGQFVCMGPIPYLKQKFAQGFTIQIRLNMTSDFENEVKKLKKSTEQQPLFVDNCKLVEEHLGLLHYDIKNPDILWSQLFKAMEDMKSNHSVIQDYVITESCLEQIFIYFAKQETAVEIERNGT